MAAYDIMPHKSVLGGTLEVRHAPLDATQTFDTGELVKIVDSGEIAEFPADTTEALIADMDSALHGGIACYGPAGGAQTNDRTVTNPKTGIAYATGDEIAYWPLNQDILWITDNFFATGAGSAVAPAQTDVGESYQLTHATFGTPDAGWGVEQTAGVAGTDVQAKIVEVLDARFDPIRISSQTGVYVVFTIEAVVDTDT